MADLPIQIVDEHDKPIGQASKQEAWEKGLIHRIVRISILDEDGNLLIQKRSNSKDIYPGCWDNSAAGHVDAEETYEQAALRELKEELGLEGIQLQVQGEYFVDITNNWRKMKRFTRAYKIILAKPLPVFNLPPDEVDSIKWMPIDEVIELIEGTPELVTDGLEQIVNRFFKQHHFKLHKGIKVD